MQKHLNKDLLGDLIIGNLDQQMHDEIIDTEEVKSMMYHQWTHPGEVHGIKKPDFKKILNEITGKTSMNAGIKDYKYLLSQFNNLKTRNQKLKKRFAVVLSLAASIILIMSLSAIFIAGRNKIFQKTYTENIAPKGQKSQVILPDGTKVYLNSGTIIKYDNLFGKTYRELTLSGEAFFEVTKNEKLPFLIKTKDVEVLVVGTKFNLMAYPEDATVETVVSEGMVSVTELHKRASLTIGKDQKATFNRATKILSVKDAGSESFGEWKDNILTFDNENFSDVIKKLERWYNVDISVQGTDSITDRFTMTIKSESLKEVLDLISLTTDIEYSIKDNKVSILYQ